jgi:hypothetical protein
MLVCVSITETPMRPPICFSKRADPPVDLVVAVGSAGDARQQQRRGQQCGAEKRTAAD